MYDMTLMRQSVNRTVVIRHVSGRFSSNQSEFDSNFGHHKVANINKKGRNDLHQASAITTRRALNIDNNKV
jgi:hypothetical protein